MPDWARAAAWEAVRAATDRFHAPSAHIARRLGVDAAVVPLPLLVAVGGQTNSLAALPDPRRILTTRGERGLVVVSGNGQVYGRVGGGWQEVGEIDDVVVPGT